MKYLYIIIPFVIISVVLLTFKSNLFSVKQERINSGLPCVGAEQLLKFIPLQGINILSVNESSLEKKVKDKYLCVDSLLVKKDYPDKVEIDLTARKATLAIASVKLNLSDLPPEATPSTQSALSSEFIVTPDLLSQASSEAKLISDSSGFIFTKMDSIPDVPLIILINTDLRLGDKIDQIAQRSLKILYKLKDLSISTGLPLVGGGSFLVDTDKGRMLFDLSGDLDRQLASLQLILSASTMNPQDTSAQKTDKNMIKSIDLRFQKPVVVYSQK